MNPWKKVGLLAALVVATLMAVIMYWSQHLTYKAEGAEDTGERIGLLEKATKYWLLNDSAHYELGKAYFDYGYRNLEDAAAGESNLRKSAGSFVWALRLNPANFYGHYDYARSLFYLDFLSPGEDQDFISEYKKAAALTGHQSDIYFEVGRVLLARWDRLSEEDREFTVEILRSINEKGDREMFESILHTWEMNVGDYGVMGQILPDNPEILRTYARFLGEKSLSSEERHKVLALAEQLEFQKTEEDFTRAENLFRYYRIKEAVPLYEACLNRLKNIQFYQGLAEGLAASSQIDVTEYADMLMTIHLMLAKCGIQQGKTLAEVEDHLRTYLKMVGRVADAGDLEKYLVERGQISSKLEDSVNDLRLLSFHCLLYFKQSRYREIKNIGSLLERSYVVVPEEEREDYIEVLRLVADANQITGYLYDALEVYQRALEVDEDNVETLLGLRRNYERLNEEREIRRIDRRLERLIAPGKIDFKDKVIGKGQTFGQRLYLDGSRVSLSLQFGDDGREGVKGGGRERGSDVSRRVGGVGDGSEGGNVGGGGEVFPLVTVVLNGRVVWEDYVNGERVVSLVVETNKGENLLEVTPINRPLTLRLLERR